jgi:hypothetical protein
MWWICHTRKDGMHESAACNGMIGLGCKMHAKKIGGITELTTNLLYSET